MRNEIPFCGNSALITTYLVSLFSLFVLFQNAFNFQNFAKLKKNYKHVEDIDLFIGMLAEPTEATDGIVGKDF